MSRQTLFPNTAWEIVVQSGGNGYSLVLNPDGSLQIPGQVKFKVGSFNGIFTHSNTSDRTYTLLDRSGTLAIQDLTSLVAMMPTVTGQNGKFLTTDGLTVSWATVPTGGITSLNGLASTTYASQTFAIGTTGNSPAFVSATGVHTLNIPLAATASVTAGLLSNADYANIPFKNQSNTFAATQTFTNAPIITTPSTASNAAATYGQLQTAKAGLSTRPPVDALDNVSLTLGIANPTIDGRVIQLNDRVLATALTTGANKVYKATGSLGAITWTVETDGQAGDGTPTDGDILFVRSGIGVGNHSDQQWAYNGSAWVLYNIAQSWTFGTGLTVTGGNAVTVNFGTTAGTVAQGNDSRFTDSRTPTAHVLDSASHTISGKTAGQVLIATAATTFGFVTFSQDLSVSATGVVAIAKIANVAINDLGLQQNSATLADNTVAATLVTGASWAPATYRAVKIEYSITRGSNYVVGSIVLMHDGTTPRITINEDDQVGTHGITFSTDATLVAGGNLLRLLYKTTSTGSAATMKFINYSFSV